MYFTNINMEEKNIWRHKTMYIHVFCLKTKLYDKINHFLNNFSTYEQDKAYITYLYHYWNNGNTSAKHNKSAKLTQNMPVGNKNIFSRIFQPIEFLSCFSTIMSTIHDGFPCKTKIGKMDNSRVVIQECQITGLPILDEILCL